MTPDPLTLEQALRLTEILLALAFIQSSGEHLAGPKDEKVLFLTRLFLSIGLLTGWASPLFCVLLCLHALFLLHRFQGPYNGGSDRMGLLVLICLTLAHLLPTEALKELAFGYLALQLILSYFISGYVKIANPDWRSGQALQDVFRFSAYPVTEATRAWAERPRLLLTMSWSVILFELAFPLAFLTQPSLVAALAAAALFHLANTFLFGLNRFFWIWLAAYPSIVWMQGRILP